MYFKCDFWAKGSSVVGINGVWPESRRFKLFNDGSFGPNDPQNNEKWSSENGHFFKEKNVIIGQPLALG
jgi:hypothetical protein